MEASLCAWAVSTLRSRVQLGGKTTGAGASALSLRSRDLRGEGGAAASPLWLARGTAITPVRESCLIP